MILMTLGSQALTFFKNFQKFYSKLSLKNKVNLCPKRYVDVHYVSLGMTLNPQCLPWVEEFHWYIIAIYVCGFHQYIIAGICRMVPDCLISGGSSGRDYEIGYGKDQAP